MEGWTVLGIHEGATVVGTLVDGFVGIMVENFVGTMVENFVGTMV